MTLIFCPNCDIYLPPEVTACPACGWARPTAAPVPAAWVVELGQSPAGSPRRLVDHLLLPTHDSGQPPQNAALYRLRLADGQPADSPGRLEVLISGLQTCQVSKTWQVSALLTTYSADPTAAAGSLLALDAAGQEAWRWQPGVQAVSAPALADETAWVTTNTGLLIGLDLATGAEQTRISLGLTPALAAPLVAEGVAYLPTRGPRLPAVGLDGQRRWQFETVSSSGWFDRTPLLARERLYVMANLVGLIIALERDTGRVIWQVELGPQVGKRLTPPVTDGTRLYAGAGDGLHAFNLADGRQVWHFPTERRIEAAPVVSGEVVYAAGHDHCLYALEAATGRELWRYLAAARIEVAPLLLDEPPLVVIADRKGQVTAVGRPLRPEEHQAAGRWLTAAEGYAARGELARAAEILQDQAEPFKAAQLWQAAGKLDQAAAQYEQAGRWAAAAALWGQLEQPLRQAEALTRHAPSPAEAETQAQVWDKAAALFQAEGQAEQAAACQREAARCRRQPLLVIEIQAIDGLVQQTYARVSFTVHNQGFGPAQQLIIRVTNKEMFAGPLAETRQLKTLRVGQASREELSVKPLEVGHVPLQFNLSYRDQHGQVHSQDYPPLYLIVARVEAERSPGPVYHIYTGGGTYVEGNVTTGGGEFVGRDWVEQGT